MPDQHSVFARRFGANLVSRRHRVGIPQEELGDLAALHRTAVGQLERGERIPRADTLVKLAAALGVDANTLLKGIYWTPPQLEAGSFAFTEDGEARSGRDSTD